MRLTSRLELPPNVKTEIDPRTQQIRLSGVNLVYEPESVPYL